MSLELLYLWNAFLPFPLVGKQAFTYHPGDSRKCVGSGGPVFGPDDQDGINLNPSFKGLCETPFPVYLSESLVFGAVETRALAASSEGGLTEVTAPERNNRKININAKKEETVHQALYSKTEKRNGTPYYKKNDQTYLVAIKCRREVRLGATAYVYS
ncbi:hypothetical protein PVK06_049920 [Gossypium arboreum]|uniref:Uncharacterized protein n=1 Tax=Gossypium arboreum TaxID=29729 RepID=A0ABR0MBD8_GOSAR|nr:hypothetical protein PVK06_049920 [Gossypium arboreum]